MQMDEGCVAQATPLFAAADLQDNLLMASNDLERLQGLLADACDTLCAGFCSAAANLRDVSVRVAPESAEVKQAMAHLGEAVTALQFQDMASQLIAHTQQRLRHCTDRLAHDAFPGEGDGAAVIAPAPERPNPVVQDEMDTGSVDLF
jgi:hypothetical protein